MPWRNALPSYKHPYRARWSRAYEVMNRLERLDPVILARLQDLQAQLEKYAWQISAHIS